MENEVGVYGYQFDYDTNICSNIELLEAPKVFDINSCGEPNEEGIGTCLGFSLSNQPIQPSSKPTLFLELTFDLKSQTGAACFSNWILADIEGETIPVMYDNGISPPPSPPPPFGPPPSPPPPQMPSPSPPPPSPPPRPSPPPSKPPPLLPGQITPSLTKPPVSPPPPPPSATTSASLKPPPAHHLNHPVQSSNLPPPIHHRRPHPTSSSSMSKTI